MKDLPIGLYDLLHTKKLQNHLKSTGLLDRAEWSALSLDEIHHRIAIPLSREIAHFIRETISKSNKHDWLDELETALISSHELRNLILELIPVKPQSLLQIKPPSPFSAYKERPDTPLSESALLTGSSRTPALRSQLIKELATCDCADWLVSFIKYAGLLPLLPTLREFTQKPAPDGGPRLRVATTSYMGATDVKAIKALLELPNTEVRISYDTKRTRLHAKAYLFHRESGFSSAYIGSANISKSALDEGLEWTAKISQFESNHLWLHTVATFEAHWEDKSEFTLCSKDDLPTFEEAILQERGEKIDDDFLSLFDLRPYGFQQIILDDIAVEREAGKRHHLIVSATGTGKTMVSAFDYRNFCEHLGKRASLLYVAHREEILKQARMSFRQVLRDGSFGDILVSGNSPNQFQHLFCSVQSWNSRELDLLSSDHFDYVVLDEAHHGSAKSYQKLIQHITPKSLLGLTATPERTDGADIRDDFGGAFTHELRLPEAVDRALLSPFHYYGIPDLEGIDLSNISWKRGGYDVRELQNILEENSSRANWVMSQTERYVADIKNVRCLGFCVSVAHAHFMAEYCQSIGIKAASLTGHSEKTYRRNIQQKLADREINFIFTVDLYNEGVDLPFVDTVLFLRPTESLTLFLQQLGRGLRLYKDKAQLTVLDFIAPQHRQFRFASRFRALSSRPELRIDKQLESEMPFVPTGCFIFLEKQAKEHVLNNIRSAAANLRGERFLNELKVLQIQTKDEITLQDILDYLHLDTPDEIYKRGLPHELLSKEFEKENTGEYRLNEGFRRLLMMDDTHFIEDAKNIIKESSVEQDTTVKSMIHTVLWGPKKPDEGKLNQVHEYILSRPGLLNDLLELFNWILTHKTPVRKQQLDMTGILNLHASYTREQILLSLGKGTFDQPFHSREGVLHLAEKKMDVFFADINKSESDFSPTTMYEDYAITDRLFHWQSQSQTSDTSNVGRRYINHEKYGYTPLLFIRERKKAPNGLTAPYFFAGPLKYKKHEGSKPISFIWELEYPLPARALSWAKRGA